MKFKSFHSDMQQVFNTLRFGNPNVVGETFYVGTAASKAYAWIRDYVSADKLFTSLDTAIGAATADRGDAIFVLPGHAETAATQVTCDKADVCIIGLGIGSNRPTITAHASAVDCFNVIAANVYIENIKIVGATSCTALLNLAGADFVARNVVFQQVATPVSAVTIANTTAARFTFKDCLFYALVNGPDYGINIEAAAKPAGPHLIENCTFNYCPAGLDAGAIFVNNRAVVSLIVKNCIFAGMEATAIDINSSDTDGGDGLITGCVVGAKGTVADIDTLIDAGGCILINNYGSDTAAEGGGLIPVTTPV